jgi:hypothetical protein
MNAARFVLRHAIRIFALRLAPAPLFQQCIGNVLCVLERHFAYRQRL